jgi:aquaporin Z
MAPCDEGGTRHVSDQNPAGAATTGAPRASLRLPLGPANFTSDFGDERDEWKRLFAEVLGTFGLVLVAAGGRAIAFATGATSDPLSAAIAPGLVVMALIYALADVSGAHFNPVVTLAFAVRGAFPWRRVPGYVVAQLAGAVLASFTLLALFGAGGGLGATVPGPHVAVLSALLIETVLTALLVIVILGTASGAKIVGHNAAIAVGAFIAVAGLIGGPVSGGSMNPARSLGPDIVRLQFGTSWIYVVGPVVGALVAVGVATLLRGPRSPAEVAAAIGFEGDEDEGR